VAAELTKMGLLGAPDIFIMRLMANSYADAEQAREEAERLRATGKKTRDILQAIGREQKREDRKLELFLRCSDRLGLSPRGRENLTIERQNDGITEIMKLLTRPRIARTGPTSVDHKLTSDHPNNQTTG
jgi:hypothetical protein